MNWKGKCLLKFAMMQCPNMAKLCRCLCVFVLVSALKGIHNSLLVTDIKD